MPTVYVQFSDDTETEVISVFGCPQDETTSPNQGEVDDVDPRYIAFITPAITPGITSPVAKLKAFLSANPDVAAILK